MEINSISVSQFANAFIAGANNLNSKKEWINELNVFPVPDGDTGTNMSMTIMSAAKTVSELEDPTMKTLAKAISSGSLRGARGNSGVILSQLFRGFSKVVGNYDTITVDVFCEAVQKSVETAYKAVMKPKEGTILTVARGIADKALEMNEVTDDFVYFLDEVLKEGNVVLQKTPDMLPVLKEAGVVDSGGQGLMCVLEGGYDYLLGKDVDLTIDGGEKKQVKESTEEIKFGYCTEFIICLEKPFSNKMEQEFKGFLEGIGDSIVVVWDGDIVKTHVHTNDPGKAISKALEHGSLTSIKIDNMREEHEEKLIKDASKKAAAEVAEQTSQVEETVDEGPAKEIGFVAVSIGEGINEIFSELGCDHIIAGGQTMNPSTEDIMYAISKVNAKNVFVFPNNKNIILAANQAASLSEDKNVIVIPTKNVPQAICSLINYIPDQSVEQNQERMLSEMENVKAGEVTYAVRDTVIDGKEISSGDYMGIGDNGIVSVNKDLDTAFIKMIEVLTDEDSELITMYYGEDVKEEDALALQAKVEEAYPDIEVELQYGGQPVYYYGVSVE